MWMGTEGMWDDAPSPLLIKDGVEARLPHLANSAVEGAGNQDRPAVPTSDGLVSRLHRLPPQAHEGRVADVQD